MSGPHFHVVCYHLLGDLKKYITVCDWSKIYARSDRMDIESELKVFSDIPREFFCSNLDWIFWNFNETLQADSCVPAVIGKKSATSKEKCLIKRKENSYLNYRSYTRVDTILIIYFKIKSRTLFL